ncbi:MAG: dTDP-4-amino-4,6-dideoxygalactose transaminase [Candidatus Omnitrophica bacterium]|nr:dTDP-4-amino-4,6-dideoxygalactose transaminase [Candidatus Omnitrophota bacterium]MDD5774431.1 dTDP-4-amino-4,6-dideoxygalactose transaminase [Candidatus Omnitrophota bacterium]
MKPIPFNKPFIAGNELKYIHAAVKSGQLAGNGAFTKMCQRHLEQRFGFGKVLMTHSATAALEMSAILCDIKAGDEVILPSFTFVSTANAFYLRGAKLKFVDIRPDTLNIDERLVEKTVTKRTRLICPVHYAGVGCRMDVIGRIAKRHNLMVVEDAAHAIGARFNGQYLGSFGDLAALSFHETKNFISGEGGALVLNSPELVERAEIIWEKGTNRKKFELGIVDKYTWVDMGSSFYPSELVSAFLYGQLEEAGAIARKRLSLWKYYRDNLSGLAEQGLLRLQFIPAGCEHNAHMFYILLNSNRERNELLHELRLNQILAVFHYVPLHSSPMGHKMGYSGSSLPVTEDVSKRLLRLPLFYELTSEGQKRIVNVIKRYFVRTKR